MPAENGNQEKKKKQIYSPSLSLTKVKMFLEKEGINVNEQCPDTGCTVLHQSIFAKPVEVADYIALCVERGVDVNIREEEHGNTALFNAIRYERELSSKSLIENYKNKIDHAVKNKKGETTLLLAAKMRNPLIGSWILRELTQENRVAVVNSSDLLGNSPAHYAFASGCLKLIRMLLGANANMVIKNNDGKTPLDMLDLPEEKLREIFKSSGINSDRDSNANYNIFHDETYQPPVLDAAHYVNYDDCKELIKENERGNNKGGKVFVLKDNINTLQGKSDREYKVESRVSYSGHLKSDEHFIYCSPDISFSAENRLLVESLLSKTLIKHGSNEPLSEESKKFIQAQLDNLSEKSLLSKCLEERASIKEAIASCKTKTCEEIKGAMNKLAINFEKPLTDITYDKDSTDGILSQFFLLSSASSASEEASRQELSLYS